MKKIISVLVLFLISATTLSNYATTKIYLPITMKSVATSTPTPTFSPPVPTLTPTPAPGVPPAITYFYCNYFQPHVYCWLDIQNVDYRPISDVKISIFYDSVFARLLDSGADLIQPGETHSYVWNDYRYTSPMNVSASIDSWIMH